MRIATSGGEEIVSAAFAIDAGGRAAPLARQIGARRRVSDRLVCGWVHGAACPMGRGSGLTVVEAVEDGWWYTGPLPDGRRVLAFLTDADLPAARIAHNTAGLVDSTVTAPEIRAFVVESKFVPISGGFTAAHSSVLKPCGAAGWVAAGDASISFDPLSAQGLLHARRIQLIVATRSLLAYRATPETDQARDLASLFSTMLVAQPGQA